MSFREDELIKLYILGYPCVSMFKSMDIHFFDAGFNISKPMFNDFHLVSDLSDSSSKWVSAPNCDTRYCNAWVNLSNGPIELSIPEMGERFYIFHFVNFFNDTIFKIGSRELGTRGGTVKIVGPSHRDSSLYDQDAILLDDDFAWIFGRIQVHLTEDVAKLDEHCSNIRVVAEHDCAYDWPRYLSESESQYFENLKIVFQKTLKPKTATNLADRFISGNCSEDLLALRNPDSDLITKAANKAKELISRQERQFPKYCQGWVWEGNSAGKPFRPALERAASAAAGLGILEAEDAIYPYNYWDDQGDALNGNNNYSLTFNKNQIPDAHYFWSLTVYKLPSYSLVTGSIENNVLNDRSNMTLNSDGGFTINLLKSDEAQTKHNTLRLPEGEFVLAMRIFGPSEKMRMKRVNLPCPTKI